MRTEVEALAKLKDLIGKGSALREVYEKAHSLMWKEVVVLSLEDTTELISEHVGKIGLVVDFGSLGEIYVKMKDTLKVEPFFGNEITSLNEIKMASFSLS